LLIMLVCLIIASAIFFESKPRKHKAFGRKAKSINRSALQSAFGTAGSDNLSERSDKIIF
jgi:hypothetical protein